MIAVVELHGLCFGFHRPLVVVVLDDRIDVFPAHAHDQFPSRAINAEPGFFAVPMSDAADAVAAQVEEAGGESEQCAQEQQKSF